MDTEALKDALFIIVMVFLMGLIFMLLWNWIMPDIFGLAKLSYWQPVGAWFLSRVIFESRGKKNG